MKCSGLVSTGNRAVLEQYPVAGLGWSPLAHWHAGSFQSVTHKMPASSCCCWAIPFGRTSCLDLLVYLMLAHA